MNAPNRRNPRTQPRRRATALQAIPLALLLAGCSAASLPDPTRFLRDASGASADRRLLPPGMDRPHPNLASVPPVPERPDIQARRSLTEALEADRAAAAQPALPGAATLPDGPVPGSPPMGAAPPPPPRLAAAPPIPAVRAPAAPPPLEPDGQPLAPREVPALPPPDLLAPAPPPGPTLLAPPARAR